MNKKLFIAFFAFLIAGLGLIGVKLVGNAMVSADTVEQQASDSRIMIILIIIAVLIFFGGGLIVIKSWASRHRHQQ